MGTSYSSVTEMILTDKLIKDAAKNGDLHTIKRAYKEGKFNNLKLKESVFGLSAKHDNLNIIKWGFEEKILNNMKKILEKILYIASINGNSLIIDYLTFEYDYDSINIYKTFIISAFIGNYCIIELLINNYKIDDITYITACLAAYKNNWGICTKLIISKINESFFNNKVTEDDSYLIEDDSCLIEKIKNFFDTSTYEYINKNSEVNRVIRRDISHPVGDIIIQYHTKYYSTQEKGIDKKHICIIFNHLLNVNNHLLNVNNQ
jgi:hypothetical protein